MEFFWYTSTPRNLADDLPSLRGLVVMDLGSAVSQGPVRTDSSAVSIIELTNPDDTGQVFELLESLQGGGPVWIFQPDATVATSVSLMKAGASHVAASFDALERAAHFLPGEPVAERQVAKGLIGVSRSIQAVATSIGLVANRRCNVLIEGETGTGKEVVAREIHTSGSRSRGPWVAVNCGAIPDALLEAELFGHVKGAFTGAVQSRPGKFESANHGTIFLDEIGDMPFPVQAKLLRVLQEKEVERLGGNERIRLDVRVIAATNLNLAERVKDGLFRQDLFYRLNVFRIALEPLRDRPEDIPDLARHFAARICAGENSRSKLIDSSAIDQLLSHDWPGNARELENVMEMAIILSGPRSTIYASDIRLARSQHPAAHGSQAHALQPHGLRALSPPSGTNLPLEGLDYQQALEAFEHDLLTQAIARTRGNKTAAADLLRLKRTTLSARMRVLESRLPRLVA